MANPAPHELYKILDEAKTIAVVGASSKSSKPAYGIMKMLQNSGYRCIPVNPNETEVLGEKCYPSLLDVPEKIDIVDVFRRAELTPPVAADAVKIGAKTFWLQLRIENEDAARIAREGGLNVVMDACIAVVLGQLDVPRKKTA